MLETDCLTVDGDSCADFALRVTDDECEPYIARGGTAYIQRGAVISDGDVGLFLTGTAPLYASTARTGPVTPIS